MLTGSWQWLKRLPALLAVPRPEPAERAQRTVTLQRHIILPARFVALAVVFYQLYQSPWLGHVVTAYEVVFRTIQNVFAAYALLIVAAAVLFYVVRRFPPGIVQWLVFCLGLGDGVFLAGLTVLTGGFESPLYWVYPAIIVLNAVSIPLATPQIVLNLVLSIFYLNAGLIEATAREQAMMRLPDQPLRSPRNPTAARFSAADFPDLHPTVANLRAAADPLHKYIWNRLTEATRARVLAYSGADAQEDEALRSALVEELNSIFHGTRYYVVRSTSPEPPEPTADPYVLRVAVLVLLTFCCYGLQVLMAAQRRALEEQKEFGFRTGQLRAAGRLAAEFAHQIKNPLAIINNVMFSLQRAWSNPRPEVRQQLEIAQEEVAKADRIITQIMGYAQLSEGRVEKLDVIAETDRAIQEVFPPTLHSHITVHREFEAEFPPLLMQRRHFAEVVGNLLQNAREALAQGGNVFVAARCRADESVEITVRDDGPGIPPDKLGRVFEAYYTTKERGTGLGLAIVKHNVELYGGAIHVESELGKGSQFTVSFPAKIFVTPPS